MGIYYSTMTLKIHNELHKGTPVDIYLVNFSAKCHPVTQE